MKKLMIIMLTLMLGFSQYFVAQASTTIGSFQSFNDGNRIEPTGQVKMKDNAHYLPTSQGIQSLENKNELIKTAYPVLDFEIVDDQNEDGIQDFFTVLKTPNKQDQLVLLSGKDGEILFSKNYTHINILNDKTFDENATILQLLYSNSTFYFIYDHHFVALNSKGTEIINNEEEDNIWKMCQVDDDHIAYTMQTGVVKCVDKTTGKTTWQTQVAKEIEAPNYNNEMKKVQLNVWDLMIKDQLLYVTSEDGTLIALNKDTGEIEKEIDLQAISQDELVRSFDGKKNYDLTFGSIVNQTSRFDPEFMGYQLQSINDDELLITAYLGNQDSSSKTSLTPKLMVYNMKEDQLKWSVDLERFNLLQSDVLIHDQKIIVPMYSSNSELTFFTYNLQGKLMSQDKVKLNYLTGEKDCITLTMIDNDYFVMQNNQACQKVSQDFKQIHYLDDEAIATKIASKDGNLILSYTSSGIVSRIEEVEQNNIENKHYQIDLPSAYQNNSSGFSSIYYDESENKIYSLIQEKNNKQEITASHIVVIDGKSGKIVKEQKIKTGESINEKGQTVNEYLVGETIQPFADLNKDGIKEIKVDQMILDGKTLDIKTMYDQSLDDTGKILDIGDVNQDGISDLILVKESTMIRYDSKYSDGMIQYVKTGLHYDYDKSLQNTSQAIKMKDLNHDGICDVIINDRNVEGKQIYRVIDSTTLQSKYTLLDKGIYNMAERFGYSGIDLNQDGCEEILYQNPYNLISILDGNTGKELYQYSYYEQGSDFTETPVVLDNLIPITMDDTLLKLIDVGDLNQDQIEDYAYIGRYYNYVTYDLEYLINVVDGKTLESLKQIRVYLNNDQCELTSIANSHKVIFNNLDKSVIFDLDLEQEIASYNNLIKSATELENEKLFIEKQDGQIGIFAYQCDFTLDEPHLQGGTIKIHWQSDQQGKMTIEEHGETLLTTSQNQVEFRLTEGSHTLLFNYDDGHGKTTTKTIDVDVKKGHGLIWLSRLGFLTVILLIILILIYPKYQLKKKVALYDK